MKLEDSVGIKYSAYEIREITPNNTKSMVYMVLSYEYFYLFS